MQEGQGTAPSRTLAPAAAHQSSPLQQPQQQTPRRYAPIFSLLSQPTREGASDLLNSTSAPLALHRSSIVGDEWQSSHSARSDDAGNDEERVPLVAATARGEVIRTAGAESAATAATPQHVVGRLWAALGAFCGELKDLYAVQMGPESAPRRFSAADRDSMQRYESTDAFEPETTLFKDYLETRSHEPRWFIWVFVAVLGIMGSAVAVAVTWALHALQRLRFECFAAGLRRRLMSSSSSSLSSPLFSVDTRSTWRSILSGDSAALQAVPAPSLLGGLAGLAVVSVSCAALASAVAALVPESVGAGVPEVAAQFNGVAYAAMSATKVLAAKLLLVVLTAGSGAYGTGHVGPLMLTGAMLGAQTLRRRRWVRFQNINLVDCFRNPRDRRMLVMIGAAAGLAAALSVSMSGLLVVMELLTTVFPTHFALYVFVACLVSCLATQVHYSYWRYPHLLNGTLTFADSWAVHAPRLERAAGTSPWRARQLGAGRHPSSDSVFSHQQQQQQQHPLQLLTGMTMLFRTELPFGQHVRMNVYQLLPAVLLGALCGCLAAVTVRAHWLSLQLRRRLEALLGSKRLVRLGLPIVFAVLCVCWQTATMALFSDGARTDGCVALPLAAEATRNSTSIGYYSLNSFLCSNTTVAVHDGGDDAIASSSTSSSASTILRARVHAYASLALGNADAMVQMLLSVRTETLLPASVLGVFLLSYALLSVLHSGVALCADTILPSLVIGGTIGRLCGLLVLRLALAVEATQARSSARAPQAGSAATNGVRSWADPGVFALIGAGSFLSATSGLTFSVAAVLMEATGDFQHLLPLMVGISVARKATELLSHDLHAVYLEMRCVPMLNFGKRIHKLMMYEARHVMAPAVDAALPCETDPRPDRVHAELPDAPHAAAASAHGGPGGASRPSLAESAHPSPLCSAREVVCLPIVTTVRAVAEALAGCTHNGFPAVSVHEGTFKGLISRAQLELLLWWYLSVSSRRRQTSDEFDPPTAAATAAVPTYDVLHRRLPDYLYHEGLRRSAESWRSLLPPQWPRYSVDAQHAAARGSRRGSRESAAEAAQRLQESPWLYAQLEQPVDLCPHVDASALCVMSATTLPRVYEMFTTLGLRHLVVVDDSKMVVGMITRKDLMADRVLERTRAVNASRQAWQAQRRQSLTASAPRQPPVSGQSSLQDGTSAPAAGNGRLTDATLPSSSATLSDDVARAALLLSTDPVSLNDWLVMPDPTERRGRAAHRDVGDTQSEADALALSPLSFLPLHPTSAQVAASLRLRRRQRRTASL